MNSSTFPRGVSGLQPLPADLPASARTLFGLLQRLSHGSLTLQLPDGQLQHFGQAESGAPCAVIHLHNWKPCAAALKSGDIGFAESYIAGDWSTPHLPGLLQLLSANRQALDAAIYGHWAGRLLYRIKHLLNRNTRANSRKNIHAHYDLGNAFYRLWLDPSMNYSSAWFEGRSDGDLTAAQHAKVARALRQVGLQPDQRLLEIGCGWGALAEKATLEFGASVTGVTLPTEQLGFARQRLADQGQSERADPRRQDYPDNDDGP